MPAVRNGSEDWKIKAIIMGDGFKKAAWRRVRRHEVHASGQARGSHGNFHEVHWDTSIFAEARDAAITFPTYAISGGAHWGREPDCIIPAKGFSRECEDAEGAVQVSDIVFRFIKKHHCVVVVLQSAGLNDQV